MMNLSKLVVSERNPWFASVEHKYSWVVVVVVAGYLAQFHYVVWLSLCEGLLLRNLSCQLEFDPL